MSPALAKPAPTVDPFDEVGSRSRLCGLLSPHHTLGSTLGSTAGSKRREASGWAPNRGLLAEYDEIATSQERAHHGEIIVRTIEAALDCVEDTLTQMRTLASQIAADVGSQDCEATRREFAALFSEYQRIIDQTAVGSMPLLADLLGPRIVQFDLRLASERIFVLVGALSGGVPPLAVGDVNAARRALISIEPKIGFVRSIRMHYASVHVRLISAVRKLGIARLNYESGQSRVQDVVWAASQLQPTTHPNSGSFVSSQDRYPGSA